MEWNEINYGMNNEAREHNGRDWAGAVSFFGLVIGRLQSGRQLAQRRDQPSSARHLFPFSSMKSIELWNWFHWIAEMEWAESEKATTNKGKEPAHWVCLIVDYELAAPPPNNKHNWFHQLPAWPNQIQRNFISFVWPALTRSSFLLLSFGAQPNKKEEKKWS